MGPAPTDPQRVLGLSTDRGSAQAIAPAIAELSRTPALDVEVVAPAAVHDVFAGSAVRVTSLDPAFALARQQYMAELFRRVRPQLLISGSSPAKGNPPETAEQYAILEARRRGVPSIGILDYWGRYRECFGSSGETADLSLVPDWIGALDRRCHADLVELGIPPARILITHNPWLDRTAREEPPRPAPILQTSGRRVLLVMQPLSPAPADASREFWQSVLRGIVSNLASAHAGVRHRVIVWRHPAQDASWFEPLAALGHDNVDVMPVEDRGAAILAHVDMLVTVHSTVAYEALHYGTPCVSLRMGIADMPASPIDEMGLAKLVRSLDELGSFLRTAEPSLMRAQILTQKRRLLDQGVFFSDGKATARVVRHARSVLQAAGGYPAQS